MVMQNLRSSPWWCSFELDPFVMATFDSFRDHIRTCIRQNVVLVYFAGHSGEGGELCFCENAKTESGMEMLGPDIVAPCVAGSSKRATTHVGGGTVI